MQKLEILRSLQFYYIMTFYDFFEYLGENSKFYEHSEKAYYYVIKSPKYLRDLITNSDVKASTVFKDVFGANPAEVTHLCEALVAFLSGSKYYWKVLEGEDIRKYYYRGMYSKCTGSLGHSCMRYKRCQDYFDIYIDNAKMLVLIPKRGYKIVGRAILWEIDGITYMDRVYGIDNHVNYLFNNYAKEHKFALRQHNALMCNGDTIGWYFPDDNYKERKYPKINLKLKDKYCYYPYLDTFRYLSSNKSTLLNELSDKCWVCAYTDGWTCRY